jgi:hypothetical protein
VDYQVIVVGALVALAVAYAAKKGWDMVKPGKKTAGCGCSGADAKSGCGGCPVARR